LQAFLQDKKQEKPFTSPSFIGLCTGKTIKCSAKVRKWGERRQANPHHRAETNR